MPTKILIDCSTGTQTEVELTAEEIATSEARATRIAEERTAMEAAEAETAANKASGQAKLAELGLSADEIAALVG
jgi:hypothetical protein